MVTAWGQQGKKLSPEDFKKLSSGQINTQEAVNRAVTPTVQTTQQQSVTPSLTTDQQAAQNYINKTGLSGGLAGYVQSQQQRYNQALSAGDQDAIQRFLDDSNRVGYSLTNPATTQVQQQVLPTSVDQSINSSNQYWSGVVDQSYNQGVGNNNALRDQELAARAAEEARRAGIRDQLSGKMKELYDSLFGQQAASLAQQKDAYLTELQKAYSDAVAAGEMSVREAEAAFAEQSRLIDAQNYQNAEQREVLASQRGIGSSAQMAGMMATDNALAGQAKNQNQVTRDGRIADIQTRINNITQQKNLDVANVNNQFAQQLIEARTSADSQYLAQRNALEMQDYQDNNAYRDNVASLAYLNNIDLNKLTTAQKQQLAQMGFGNDIALRQMAQQQQYQKELMELGQKYDLSKMSQAQQYTLEQMATGQNYDLEKMDKGLVQDLEKMAKAYGYDVAQMAQSFKNQQALQAQQINAQKQLQQQQIEAEANQYALAIQREMAKYTPGTSEYTIRQKQMEDQFNQQFGQRINELGMDISLDKLMGGISPSLQQPSGPLGGLLPPSQGSINQYNQSVDANRMLNEMMKNVPGWQPLPETPYSGKSFTFDSANPFKNFAENWKTLFN